MQRTTSAAFISSPKSNKGRRHQIVSLMRAFTARMRLTPDFIIIGAQKCGTTSLYHNLTKHPNIAPCFVKEVHYFDINFAKGIVWYRSHFPSLVYRYFKQVRKQPVVTGESSPYYLFHPHVPKRIAEMMPHVKLIVMLRNPLERAYSHYQHEVRKGFEMLSFKDAVDKEEERLLGEKEKLSASQDYHSFNHRHYSYLSRGIYVDQLMSWMQWFPRDQLFVLKSENFYQDSGASMDRVATFLELPSRAPIEYGKYNSFKYPPMEATMRTYLRDFFRPHNQRLSDFLGGDIDWDM